MNGVQSVLAPRGQDAERIATLFWTMLGGGTLIMLAVALLTALALKGDLPGRGWLRSERLVVWAGLQDSPWSLVLIYPTITLPVSIWLLIGFL